MGRAPRQGLQQDFYPRSPCGERHTGNSIGRGNIIFLSTLSLRRATLIILCPKSAPCISIHALLAESDALRQLQSALR